MPFGPGTYGPGGQPPVAQPTIGQPTQQGDPRMQMALFQALTQRMAQQNIMQRLMQQRAAMMQQQQAAGAQGGRLGEQRFLQGPPGAVPQSSVAPPGAVPAQPQRLPAQAPRKGFANARTRGEAQTSVNPSIGSLLVGDQRGRGQFRR